MLVALNTIAATQANGTKATMAACTLLNYTATHPDDDAVVQYKTTAVT
jgi:hypothetical protein